MFAFNIKLFILIIATCSGLFAMTSAYYCNTSYPICGNQLPIPYPFYNPSYSNTSVCGYPGFEMGCLASTSTPAMNISNSLYYVPTMLFTSSERYLGVVAEDVYTVCPRPMQNFTLELASPFISPYSHTGNITFFYNCSGYPEDVVQHLPCLDTYYNGSVGRSFAFYGEDYWKYGFDWHTGCEENVMVPANIINTSDYRQGLIQGFRLYWSTPDDCKDCERSYGQCLYNQTGGPPLCSCPNTTRLYHGSCPKPGGEQEVVPEDNGRT